MPINHRNFVLLEPQSGMNHSEGRVSQSIHTLALGQPWIRLASAGRLYGPKPLDAQCKKQRIFRDGLLQCETDQTIPAV